MLQDVIQYYFKQSLLFPLTNNRGSAKIDLIFLKLLHQYLLFLIHVWNPTCTQKLLKEVEENVETWLTENIFSSYFLLLVHL